MIEYIILLILGLSLFANIILIYNGRMKNKDISTLTDLLSTSYMTVSRTYLLMSRIDLSEAFRNDDEVGQSFTNLKNLVTELWLNINRAYITNVDEDKEWLSQQLEEITKLRKVDLKDLESLSSPETVDFTNDLIKNNQNHLEIDEVIKDAIK